MENEFNLLRANEAIIQQLHDIEASDQYILGKKLYNIAPLRWIFQISRRQKKKHTMTCVLEKKNNHAPVEAMSREEYVLLQSKKIVIYTCITGDYDNLIPPLYQNSNYDYFLITNNKNITSNKWKVVLVDNKGLSDIELNRYYKMHPQDIFPSYDYSIYVDGNLEVISDLSPFISKINKQYGLALSLHPYRQDLLSEIKACRKYKKGDYDALKKQIKQYINNGFPLDYGLLEAPVIATDLNSPTALDILNQWWLEFLRSESKRDQVSLPYVLWQNNVPVDKIGTLSNDIFHSNTFGSVRRHQHD